MKDNWNFQKAILYLGLIVVLIFSNSEVGLLKIIAALLASKIILIDG